MSIVEDLEKILTSRYGKDVRQSIHDAISDINDIAEDAQSIASTAQDSAASSATAASASATSAENSAISANNAKISAQSYAEDAERYAQSIGSALRPMGTVTFANLPSLASADAGDMYNISDEFTTTSDFVEGEGHTMPAGSNVYKTIYDKWDVLAGALDSEANKLIASDNIKNLLRYPWYAFDGGATSYSSYSNGFSGLSFVLNNDGSVRLRIAEACTSTDERTFCVNYKLPIKKGRYTINGTYHYESGTDNNIYLTYVLTQDGTAGNSEIVPQNGKTFVVSGTNNDISVYLVLPVGNYTSIDTLIKPMIRPESFGDDTFTPMAESPFTDYLRSSSEKNAMFGKNLIGLLPYDTSSMNGITLTANSDGSILLNGTTSNNGRQITIRKGIVLSKGKYYLSGGTHNARILLITGGNTTTSEDRVGAYINITSETATCRIDVYIPANADVDGTTIYPMIRHAGTTEDYVGPSKNPYEDRPVYYGICSTAAGTADKEVTFAYPIVTSNGTKISVDFANVNTATTPKMVINGGTTKYNIKYKNTSGNLVTYANIPSGLQTFTFQGGELIADGLVGKIEQINDDLNDVGTSNNITTITQLNTQKDIDLTGYRFVILNVLVASGMRVGNTIIPTSILPSTNHIVLEIGTFEGSSANTANLIHISKTWINVKNAITTGWAWGGVEVIGIK